MSISVSCGGVGKPPSTPACRRGRRMPSRNALPALLRLVDGHDRPPTRGRSGGVEDLPVGQHIRDRDERPRSMLRSSPRPTREVMHDSERHVAPLFSRLIFSYERKYTRARGEVKRQRSRVPRPRGVGVVGGAHDAAPDRWSRRSTPSCAASTGWPSPSSMCSSRCTTRPVNASACRPLADRVLLSPAGTTHLVTRLERDGMVRREVDPTDRRKWFTVLTVRRRPKPERSPPTHNDVLRRTLLSATSATDRRTLQRVWHRLAKQHPDRVPSV